MADLLTVRYELRGLQGKSAYLVDQDHPKGNQRQGKLGVLVMKKTMLASIQRGTEAQVFDITLYDGDQYRIDRGKVTKRFVRFKAVLDEGETMRTLELPYVYMTKQCWTEIGEPIRFGMSIEPLLPRV